eukprot:TRINITY_DN61814_c0_g1_i1.p1 TRINITY_DN61814_c0_g1~~TRINITY_DN61814_c0_g1_i1.p1  ORF type:complete len:484 (-),score=31.37 TRINITY_DN61814_c0_g1_i1:598-2049(-)
MPCQLLGRFLAFCLLAALHANGEASLDDTGIGGSLNIVVSPATVTNKSPLCTAESGVVFGNDLFCSASPGGGRHVNVAYLDLKQETSVGSFQQNRRESVTNIRTKADTVGGTGSFTVDQLTNIDWVSMTMVAPEGKKYRLPKEGWTGTQDAFLLQLSVTNIEGNSNTGSQSNLCSDITSGQTANVLLDYDRIGDSIPNAAGGGKVVEAGDTKFGWEFGHTFLKGSVNFKPPQDDYFEFFRLTIQFKLDKSKCDAEKLKGAVEFSYTWETAVFVLNVDQKDARIIDLPDRPFCGDPGTIEFGSQLGTSFYADDRVDYVCDEPLVAVPNGRRRLTCQSDGKWDFAPPTCEGSCLHPGSVNFGSVTPDSTTKWFVKDQTISVSCDNGWADTTLSSHVSTLTCVNDDQWEPAAFSECAPPPDPDTSNTNGNGNSSSSDTNNATTDAATDDSSFGRLGNSPNVDGVGARGPTIVSTLLLLLTLTMVLA